MSLLNFLEFLTVIPPEVFGTGAKKVSPRWGLLYLLTLPKPPGLGYAVSRLRRWIIATFGLLDFS